MLLLPLLPQATFVTCFIILQAGQQLPLTPPPHPRLQAFFRNFMTLLLLGVVGTWMTAAMVAAGA